MFSLDQSLIANAQLYPNAQITANHAGLFDVPLEKDLRSLSLQIVINDPNLGQKTSWNFDLSNGNPNAPLSQLAAIYVDMTDATHDALFYIPETNFTHVFKAGACQLIPVVGINKIPKFFITLLSNMPSQNWQNAIVEIPGNSFSDIINVTLFNKYVPPFYHNDTIRNQPYNLASNWQPKPVYAMDNCFPAKQVLSAPHVFLGIIATTIPGGTNNQYFLKALQISFTGHTSAAAAKQYNLKVYDGYQGTTLSNGAGKKLLFEKEFTVTGINAAADNDYQILNFTDLNYLSLPLTLAGNNPGLWAVIDNAGSDLVGTMYCNATGGTFQ